MIEKHLAKLRKRDEISPEEEQALRDAISEIRDYPADAVVVRAGEELHNCTLLIDGLLARQKDLRGGQRQITELHVPGDFADLHSFTLKRLDHEVMALAPSRLALVPHENLKRITQDHPHLTRVYWFTTNLDASIHREWEVSLGRRDALSRTAHLFCELYVRLEIVGLTDGLQYDLRMTQAEVSECLGLTPVHVNRTLRELRERGLVEFQKTRVSILDMAGLRRIAEFDPAYLYLERRPR